MKLFSRTKIDDATYQSYPNITAEIDPSKTENYSVLVCVSAGSAFDPAQHNKCYVMGLNKDGTIDVMWGKVGGLGTFHRYHRWEKDYYDLKQSKEYKGYEDKTALWVSFDAPKDPKKDDDLSCKPVDDPQVQELLTNLIEASRQFVKQNYTIKSEEVTQKMVDEADADIRLLSDIADNKNNSTSALYRFNDALLKLFSDVPRAMGNDVSSYLAHSTDDFGKLIQREVDMLDNLRAAVKTIQLAQQAPKDGKAQTVLEKYGLDMHRASYKQEDEITAHLGTDYGGKSVECRFVKAFVAENHQTRKRYEDYVKAKGIEPKQIKLFYHGSKVENWFSIFRQGMSLNPNALITGKMFGQGLYFAPDARKALNYMDTKSSCWNRGSTRDTGYISVSLVACGKAYTPTHTLGSHFFEKDLPAGCGCVYAPSKRKNSNLGYRLENDEYVVFNQDACTIKYLLEMKDYDARELNFSIDRKGLRNELIDHTTPLVKISDHKFRTEILYEQLSDAAAKELGSIMPLDGKYHLVAEYDATLDKTAFYKVDDKDNEQLLLPSLTNDDYSFIQREIKKNFAKGEFEFVTAIKESDDKPIGYAITTLNGTNCDGVHNKEVEQNLDDVDFDDEFGGIE